MADWQFRPARDHGMTPAQRLRSAAREPGVGSLVAGSLTRGLIAPYLRAAHGFGVSGEENLPEPPFVMIANHASHFDALCLECALPRPLARRAFALAAGDTFFTSTPRAALAAYALRALPVWRRQTSARDLDALRAKLHEEAAILILFPEGTRTRTGAMGPFQPGIGALLAGTAIPAVPCWIEGAFAAWPPTRRLPHLGCALHVTIGAPLLFQDHAHDRAGMRDVAAVCQAAVRGLSGIR